ncbi:MAG: putative internalin [Frankiales bacterium]|nr:putative internalin [Frankiales bacterium]
MPKQRPKALRLPSLAGLPGFAVVGLVLIGMGGTTVVLMAKATVHEPTITSGPVAGTSVTATTASFAFTDSPPGLALQCQLDNLVVTACTSPKAYSALAEGSHTFRVRAVSGSQQSAFTTRSWSVDHTAPPAPTFTHKPAAASNTSHPSFGFSDGEPVVSYQCQLDTAPSFTSCTNPQSYDWLAQGNHSIRVRARDSAGNLSAAPASYSWIIDTIAPPRPVITQKPSDPASGATQTFAFTDSEALVGFACSVENRAFVTCASPHTYVVDTRSQGLHQFEVRAVDTAGNVSSNARYAFRVAQGAGGLSFVISGGVSDLVLGVWQVLPLHIPNPNSVPMYVTALTVTVSADSSPAGCLSGANIELQQSDISATHRVTVPANGSVDLPAQGVSAPQIRLQDLPTKQDFCKSRSFALTYTATANSG